MQGDETTPTISITVLSSKTSCLQYQCHQQESLARDPISHHANWLSHYNTSYQDFGWVSPVSWQWRYSSLPFCHISSELPKEMQQYCDKISHWYIQMKYHWLWILPVSSILLFIIILSWLQYSKCRVLNIYSHDDIIKWKHFPRYWPFVRGIHQSPVNSPHKGQ